MSGDLTLKNYKEAMALARAKGMPDIIQAFPVPSYQLIVGPEHGWTWKAVRHIQEMAEDARRQNEVFAWSDDYQAFIRGVASDQWCQFEDAMYRWIRLEMASGRNPYDL